MTDFISNINPTGVALVASVCVVVAGAIYKCYLNLLDNKQRYNISNKFLVVPYKNVSKVEFKDD